MTNRVRLLPSCVFICLSALNLAQLRILSMIADFETESNVSLHTNGEHYSADTFLDELFGKGRLAAELSRGESQLFLRLRVERRILDEGIDEDPHMRLDLRQLDRRCLVFLRDCRQQALRNLVRNEGDVCSTFRCSYRVGKRDMLHCARVGERERYFPALGDALVKDSGPGLSSPARHFLRCCGRRVDVHIDVLLEALDRYAFIV